MQITTLFAVSMSFGIPDEQYWRHVAAAYTDKGEAEDQCRCETERAELARKEKDYFTGPYAYFIEASVKEIPAEVLLRRLE